MARAYQLSAFGVWLKSSLAERQMTQKELAELLGTTEVNISRYVRGGRTPREPELSRILNIFKCHIEILPDQKDQGDQYSDAEKMRGIGELIREQIGRVKTENVEVQVVLEPERTEIIVQPWEPIRMSCPYHEKGGEENGK